MIEVVVTAVAVGVGIALAMRMDVDPPGAPPHAASDATPSAGAEPTTPD